MKAEVWEACEREGRPRHEGRARRFPSSGRGHLQVRDTLQALKALEGSQNQQTVFAALGGCSSPKVPGPGVDVMWGLQEAGLSGVSLDHWGAGRRLSGLISQSSQSAVCPEVTQPRRALTGACALVFGLPAFETVS